MQNPQGGGRRAESLCEGREMSDQRGLCGAGFFILISFHILLIQRTMRSEGLKGEAMCLICVFKALPGEDMNRACGWREGQPGGERDGPGEHWGRVLAKPKGSPGGESGHLCSVQPSSHG